MSSPSDVRSPRRGRAAIVTVALALLCIPAAAAKELKPGDVSICGATKCVAIVDPKATEGLESLIYTGPAPLRTVAPAIGVQYYKLRFSNGYVPGIVASARLDRFLSYGVVLERFRRGKWYGVPPTAARELRRMTANMKPLRLTVAAVAKSR